MWKIVVLLLWISWTLPLSPAAQPSLGRDPWVGNPGTGAQPPVAEIEVINRKNSATTAITDGDLIQLRLKLNQPAAQETPVAFLAGSAKTQAASCAIQARARDCTTPPFRAFGWYWAEGDVPSPGEKALRVSASFQAQTASVEIKIRPRPVVMVHGFLSNAAAWENYLGPGGYLAGVGIAGFAVGDGQVEGTMNTGSMDQPTRATNTIAQNAGMLKSYIERVKAKTGAEVIDLVGHSMGGMISRYYIDRLMADRDVAQLIMLGTPSAGSDCAILPAALGFYLPTVLEIRSSYMTGVFNPQIRQRHDVPFFALAGTKISVPVGSPCTSVPSDLVVSLDSVTSIGVTHSESPIFHHEMNTARAVFEEFVLPLLRRQPSESWVEPDPPVQALVKPPLQFTRVYTGHVDPGGSVEQVITLEDRLSVAGFALYDPTRSLAVEVTGASGRVIRLTAEQHGLVQVEDPASLVTLGYGFANPAPGPWKIRLSATERTPAGGADFALTANLAGGAELQASADPLLPGSRTPVQIRASLALSGEPLNIQTASAVIHAPDGSSQTLALTPSGASAQAEWQPSLPGVHGIDLAVTALLRSGTPIERTIFMTIEAQAEAQPLALDATSAGFLMIFPLAAVPILAWLVYRFVFRRKKSGTA